ncbi:MAG: DUF3078 domain-containing protein [Bacteroidota bacterium]
MKKNLLTITLLLLLPAFCLQAQTMTMEELKAKKADLEAQQAAKQAEADSFNAEIGDLAKQIQIMKGWEVGVSGLVGLSLGSSNNWQASANPNSSSSVLNIGINGFANLIKEKHFWRNTLTSNLAWQGLDINTNDDQEGSDFLEDRTVDLLIFSSLYGYRLNSDIAISALADLNTSVFDFLSPGTLDIGVGVTWTPAKVPNLVVVVHPLTYNFAFSGVGDVDSQSALGAKLKATYTYTFPGNIVWSSNLSAFLPYSDEKFPVEYLDDDGVTTIMAEEGLLNYTWINSFNIADIWKGIGVGFTVGLREAKFEHPDLQTYTAFGITYGF